MEKSKYFLLMSFFFFNFSGQEALNSISTKELKLLLEKGEIQLVDVRTPEEIKGGAIKTALFVNYFDVGFEKVVTAKLNKLRPVYLYCRSGARSTKAGKILKKKGFEVVNVLGGYQQWILEEKQSFK
jgi:rhodanese-related sulfurtransferase